MKYTILTLFPEITDAFFANSIMAKALKRGIIDYQAINIRDFAQDKHKTCDDAPYGGGPGMLMLPDPLGRALEAAGAKVKIQERREEWVGRKGELGLASRFSLLASNFFLAPAASRARSRGSGSINIPGPPP
jgi:tRNA G37 N-methylase TrmD